MRSELAELNNLLEQLQKDYDAAADTRRGISYAGAGIRSARTSSAVESAFELREKIAARILETETAIDREKKSILDTIAGIDNAYDRLIYFWRNIELLSFAEIGRRIGKTSDAARVYYNRLWGADRSKDRALQLRGKRNCAMERTDQAGPG